MNKPTGNVTFFFTDIEGSTKLAQEFPDTIPAALEIHNKILTEAIESNNGFVFEIVGDAFCAAFENADDAVKAAIAAQINLAEEKWKDAVIKVRMGIHSGQAEWNGKRYMGYITLARTARVMSASYGEQIIISDDSRKMLPETIALSQSREDTKFSVQNFETLSLRGENTIFFRDLGERRLKDVIKPIKLFQVTVSGLREDFPPLKTLDARPNNLPVQLSSFIGREDEIKQIKELLNNTHLLTLTGSGGSGKTRISLQTGADLIDDFANGVWFVELAPVSNPQLLPHTIMSALGIVENPKDPPEKTLNEYLRDKEILILLDNCEHLIEACAILVENLLITSSNLKVLATSREALKCKGEQIFRIPSLSQPDPEANDTLDQLSQYESVQLFIERAQVINNNFRVTNENLPALAEICSRLDGIPLAIELAAARIKILSLEQIFERLDDRFSLLKGGTRTALPRQQTLRALIDWSYDLLTEKEKLLWSRLSVFNGGWTLYASEKICSDEKIDESEIIELLQNLSEKSIIIFNENNERYNMLETIKQYGKEKLSHSEDYKEICISHMEFYTELAETADLKLEGPEIITWLNILDQEKDNMERGLKYSCDNNLKETEARLAGALGYYWKIRGKIAEGYLRFENIIKNNPGLMSIYFIKVKFLFGNFAFLKGEYQNAIKYISESYDEYRNIEDKIGEGRTLSQLGVVSHNNGEYDKGIEYLEKGLAIQSEIGDKKGMTVSLHNLGIISKEKGQLSQATIFMEESLNISREIGDKKGIAESINSLGNVALVSGDLNKASDLLEESLEINRELGDKRGIAQTLNYLAGINFKKAEYHKAIENLEEILEIFPEIGDKIGTAHSFNNLGLVYKETKEFDKAIYFMEKSNKIMSELGNKKGIANFHNNMGLIYMEKKELSKAIEHFEESLKIRRETGNKLLIPTSLVNLGSAYIFDGKSGKAGGFLRESLFLSIELDSKTGIAETLLRFIQLHINLNTDIPLAKLFGFLEYYYESNKIFLPEYELKSRDESVAILKEKMSEEEYAKSFKEGKSMNLDQVINLILNF